MIHLFFRNNISSLSNVVYLLWFQLPPLKSVVSIPQRQPDHHRLRQDCHIPLFVFHLIFISIHNLQHHHYQMPSECCELNLLNIFIYNLLLKQAPPAPNKGHDQDLSCFIPVKFYLVRALHCFNHTKTSMNPVSIIHCNLYETLF